MMVIADTCIWSLALRRSRTAAGAEALELERLIRDRRVRMLGPIRQELLSGIRDEAAFERLRAHLSAFPDLPVETGDHERAASFFNQCRGRGVQGSNTDFLICAVAARHGLAIYTVDRDFERFAAHLPVALHRPQE
jgi:predicted nucleic acid-binding protein